MIYPDAPPEVTFATKIFHPNVSPEGEIGLIDLSPYARWEQTPIREILEEIVDMLSRPSLVPFELVKNQEAADLYKNDKEACKTKAIEWVKLYAAL